MLEPSFQSLIHNLPKVELHVHLEGSVRPDTLRELARRRRRLERETEDWIAARAASQFRYSGFAAFLNAFKLVTLLLDSPADYALAATRLIEQLAAERVRYAEITLSAGVILWKGQPVEAVMEAVAQTAVQAQDRTGVRTAWILDAIRHFGAKHAREVARLAAKFGPLGVVAFGIGGDEQRGPAALFRDVYAEARDLGLRLTAHAGEAAGPESVRDAVELLGAERIGHGLAAARDPAVLALLRDRQIPLEICLTSNAATGFIASVADHPLPKFLQAGVIVTLNSDDPAMFATTLEQEYAAAAENFSLARQDLVNLAGNAIRASFLGPLEQRRLLDELTAASGN